MNTTTVINLATGEDQAFSLAPDKAVVAAFEQARRNFSTWQYPKPAHHPHFRDTGPVVYCCDFAAMKAGDLAKVAIPDLYYAVAEPERCNYLDHQGGGLRYKLVGEAHFEAMSAFGGSPDDQWMITSLLNPRIIGFDRARRSPTLVAANIPARYIIIGLSQENSRAVD